MKSVIDRLLRYTQAEVLATDRELVAGMSSVGERAETIRSLDESRPPWALGGEPAMAFRVQKVARRD